MDESYSKVITDAIAAYKPLLSKLSQSVKFEMYRAIYAESTEPSMTEEVLSLGVALTADADIQQYLNLYLRKNPTGAQP